MCERIYDAPKILQELYSHKEKKEILQSLNDISINTARIVEFDTGGLGELGIDFALDEERKLWIIEINGKPQKDIYKDLKGYQYKKLIYSRSIEYAYYLSQA